MQEDPCERMRAKIAVGGLILYFSFFRFKRQIDAIKGAFVLKCFNLSFFNSLRSGRSKAADFYGRPTRNTNMDLSPDQDRPNVRIPPPLVFFALLGIAGTLEYGFGSNYPGQPLGLRSLIALAVFLFSGYLALHAFVVLKKQGTFIDTNRPTTQIVTASLIKI